MKRTFNLTTSAEDLDRLRSPQDLMDLLEGFDGLELMVLDEDDRGLIPPGKVLGLHMICLPYWLDFWRQDRAALLAEFGDWEACRAYYGGDDPTLLVEGVRKDLARALHYGAEYMVYHIAHASIAESITGKYRHNDEEVIDASCKILNEALGEDDRGVTLLLENLWAPGLTFTRPEMTRRLMEGIRYPNKGIMLDTGHLMHTDTSLRSQEEAIAYIHRMLDDHGELAAWVKGMHLNQSLTGAYHQSVMDAPPPLAGDYAARYGQLFAHIFKVDTHQPFTNPAVAGLVQRIGPDYLTFEMISSDNGQLKKMLDTQAAALAAGWRGI